MLAAHRYYYLKNFQRALNWISERYGDLLDASERAFLLQFAELPQGSQALLVRMLMRRGPWFLQSKLVYDEIPSISDAVVPLLHFGLVDSQQPLGLDELFTLHTKSELLLMFADFPMQPSLRKAEMLEALRHARDEQKTYALWNLQSPHAALRVMVGQLNERFRLMFFGNMRQGWSEFVLADLGVFKYEDVKFDAESRAFQSRVDVDCYLELYQCRQRLGERGEICNVLRDATRCVTANPWLEARRARLLLRIGQACERLQDWVQAEAAYLQTGYPGARYRRMRVYERTARHAEAFDLAKVAEASPESEEERQRVQRMLIRLQRRLGATSKGRCSSDAAAQNRTDVTLCLSALPGSVESALRDHFHNVDAPVFYVENTLINSLFGLLCWEAIFAPVPGAFFHPFQTGPADLNAPDFVQRRRPAFDACLAQLDDGTHCHTIRQHFGEKHGVQSPFVFWGALPEGLMDLALQCIPAAHLKLFFLRLLSDINANRTGLPDLVRFWPAQCRYELVEVKGPGDKLQDNQIRWLQYFQEHGIPASVCYVKWREAPDHQPLQQGDAEQVTA